MRKILDADASEIRQWERIATLISDEAGHGSYLSGKEVPRVAERTFYESLTEIVLTSWAAELPQYELSAVEAAVKAGIRTGCRELTREIHTAPATSILSTLFSLEPYWEPPVTDTEPDWPKPQLQAYRWTAALLANAVRAELEELHASYTSDDSMPTLNRRLRNTLYTGLLRNPPLGSRLSILPRVYLEARALSGDPGPLPPVVG